MTSQRLSYRVEDGIARVCMTRADKRNALDRDMIEALVSVARQIRKDRTVRAVVLSGEGESFCAGLDFPYVAKHPGIIPRFFLKLPWSEDNMFQRVAHIWRKLPVPVIAVIQGHCFGGGMQLALGCDFRLVAPDAQMSIMEMKWGLIPDMSGTVALSRLTRLDVAQELTMTGRIVSGQEAHELGLATRVAEDPLTQANALAAQLALQSPNAVAVSKRLFQKTWHVSARKALWWERMMQLRLLGRKNQRIAMSNGMKKETRPFIDR